MALCGDEKMKANVYSLDGNVVKQIALPELFKATYRDDLIKRAVLSEESKTYQPKGNYKFAGLETSARYRGRKEDYGAIKNRGISHLPHEVLPKGRFGKVKRVPHAVKGRRAHPPKTEKKLIELINAREYKLALKSALAASCDTSIVGARHNIQCELQLPVIVVDDAENLNKTKDALKLFEKLGFLQLLQKCKKNGCKGPLVVVAAKGSMKGARNINGVDVVTAAELGARHLAPGGNPGRLMLLTESGLKKLAERF